MILRRHCRDGHLIQVQISWNSQLIRMYLHIASKHSPNSHVNRMEQGPYSHLRCTQTLKPKRTYLPSSLMHPPRSILCNQCYFKTPNNTRLLSNLKHLLMKEGAAVLSHIYRHWTQNPLPMMHPTVFKTLIKVARRSLSKMEVRETPFWKVLKEDQELTSKELFLLLSTTINSYWARKIFHSWIINHLNKTTLCIEGSLSTVNKANRDIITTQNINYWVNPHTTQHSRHKICYCSLSLLHSNPTGKEINQTLNRIKVASQHRLQRIRKERARIIPLTSRGSLRGTC